MAIRGIRVTGKEELINEILKMKNAGANMIVGPAGIGKTYMMEELAAELGAKLFVQRMSGMTEELLQGIPMFTNDGTSFGLAKMDFLDYIVNNPEERILLFIDEINRTPKRLKPALFSLLERNIEGKHYPNLVLVSALNIGEGYEENWEIQADQALLSRCIIYDYTPVPNDAYDHFERVGYNRHLIDAAKRMPGGLINHNVVEDYEQSTNYRSWYKLNEALVGIEDLDKVAATVNKYGPAVMNDVSFRQLREHLAIMQRVTNKYDILEIIKTGTLPKEVKSEQVFEVLLSVRDALYDLAKVEAEEFTSYKWVKLLEKNKEVLIGFLGEGKRKGLIKKSHINNIVSTASLETKTIIMKIL